MFRAVETEAEIRAARDELARTFSADAIQVQRTVGFPGPLEGYRNATLNWHPSLSVWGFFPKEPRVVEGGERSRYCNFFGTSIQNSSIAHVVKRNLAEHRHPAGRAFRDTSGNLYIGHRGRLGGGRATVNAKRFWAEAIEAGFALVTVRRSDLSSEDVILVGSVVSESVAKDLALRSLLCALARTSSERAVVWRQRKQMTAFTCITRNPAVMGAKLGSASTRKPTEA